MLISTMNDQKYCQGPVKPFYEAKSLLLLDSQASNVLELAKLDIFSEKMEVFKV